MASPEKAGREASPTADVSDSQSVKTTESDGPRGYGAGKKIKGRKRHIVTDTAGRLVGLIVHIASTQDRDGAVAVLAFIRRLYPWLRHIFADGGYAGDKLRNALAAIGHWTVQIIKRSDTAEGFEVLPRRWVVERTLAWLGRAADSQRTSRQQSKAQQRGPASPKSSVSRAPLQGVDNRSRHSEPETLRGRPGRVRVLLLTVMWTIVIIGILDLASARLGSVRVDTAVYE